MSNVDGRRLSPKLLLLLTRLAVGAAAAFPAHSSATASARKPETLAYARAIRAEVEARYRRLPGRKLAVTEATSTGVVETLTLMTRSTQRVPILSGSRRLTFIRALHARE
jgi:hypothetical protein